MNSKMPINPARIILAVFSHPVAMDNLYRIVSVTAAKIVVISSWKGIYGLEELRQMWQERGYKEGIYDVTRNGISDELL
jgi:hypothetical protein